MLFNIYVKALRKVIQRSGLKYHQYAADSQLYLSFLLTDFRKAIEAQTGIEALLVWMRASKIKPNKTAVLHWPGNLQMWMEVAFPAFKKACTELLTPFLG